MRMGVERDIACLHVLRHIHGAIDIHRSSFTRRTSGADSAIEFDLGGRELDLFVAFYGYAFRSVDGDLFALRQFYPNGGLLVLDA